jgi:hypothetical protein
MNELQKIAALLRHPDKEERRLAIQKLADSKQRDALVYLNWSIKNETDAELKSFAMESANRLRLEVGETVPEVAKYPSVQITSTSLEAKEKRVEAKYPQPRYDGIDTFIGFAFWAAFLISLNFGPWLNLGNLRLETGGTYQEIHGEQVVEISSIDSKLSMFAYLILMILGTALAVVHINFRGFLGFLRIIVRLIPPRLTYWLALLTVLCIFADLWFWYAVNAKNSVERILDRRNIEVLPYNLLNVTTLDFWLYQSFLIVLIAICVYGITRHSPRSIPAPKNGKQ